MNTFKGRPPSRLSGYACEAGDEQKVHTSGQDAGPLIRTVLPFARRNYSYAPAQGAEDIATSPEEDDEPGPSAA